MVIAPPGPKPITATRLIGIFKAVSRGFGTAHFACLFNSTPREQKAETPVIRRGSVLRKILTFAGQAITASSMCSLFSFPEAGDGRTRIVLSVGCG
jgi:hypothetical protein